MARLGTTRGSAAPRPTGHLRHLAGAPHSPWYGPILSQQYDVRRIQRHPADPRRGGSVRLALYVVLLAVAVLAAMK